MEQRLHDYQAEKKKGTSAVQALHEVAELCHKRSLIIVFTDLLEKPESLDSLFQAIQHMKHNKHEVVLFHVIDQQTEVDFDLDNRPVNLVDMETGEHMKLMPSEIKAHYSESIQAYFKQIQLKCAQYGIDFATADIQNNLRDVLTAYLLKRQQLY